MGSLTPYERETIVTLNDLEDVAHIFTHQTTIITKLKKNPEATLLAEGLHGTTKWAQFEMPANLISFRSKTRTISKEQAKAAGERLANARASR